MSELFVGLMSGTSIDGVDAVLASFSPLTTHALVSLAMPAPLRRALADLQASGPDELERACQAGNQLAALYADAVTQLLQASGRTAADIRALGAHGQTVRHRPADGYTIQLLNGALLAELTGIDTVCDLRSADVAAGGQGAPLVPAFHAEAFSRPGIRRAIVNIGGIANVTLIADDMPVRGHDTGPGNGLMDLWTERHLGKAFDDGGRWAMAGKPSQPLLDRLLAEPYFSLPTPKSTGRDLFNAGWLDAVLAGFPALEAADVQATLLQLTARSIATDCAKFGAAQAYVCGGGARNGALMDALRSALPGVAVADTGTLGLDPQAVEATAFAWLAMRRLAGLSGNLPSVTGARGFRVLGAVHRAR